MIMIKFDGFLLRSFLKHVGMAILVIGAIALVGFACYIIYLSIVNVKDYVSSNPVSFLKGLGYVLGAIAIISVIGQFIESIIKDANSKRKASEEKSDFKG